jgi:hypothetical protein
VEELKVPEPTPHDRKTMGAQQMETALRLYFEGSDFYSVITLAGAADEIFGQMLRNIGKQPKLDSIKMATKAIYEHLYGEDFDDAVVAERANRARNALKHWHPSQPDVVWFIAAEEAKDMLDRAVYNFWSLEHTLSPAMDRFMRARYAGMVTATPGTRKTPGPP